MKRTLLLILALCLLFDRLRCSGEADTQSSDTSEELSTTAETTTEPIKEAALLDSCEAFDDSGALWYIPNGQIEAQQYPMLRTFAGNLLMTTTSYISDGNSEMKLTLLSATTGEALQNCTVGLTESVEPQILGTTLPYATVSLERSSCWMQLLRGDRTLHSFRRSRGNGSLVMILIRYTSAAIWAEYVLSPSRRERSVSSLIWPN